MFLNVFRRLRDRTSMRRQSAAVTGFLSFATVAAITIPTALLVYDRAHERSDAEMRDLATTMAQRLDREMFERHREVQNIASLRPLGSRWRESPGDARATFEQLQRTLPSYAWIGLASPDGTVRASTKGMLEGVSVAERPWFQAGMRGPVALDIHEARLLADMLGPTQDGQPFRFVDVAAPVYDEAGALVGVLGTHLSWSWARDVRSQLLSAFDPELETDLQVTAADGSVILGGAYGSPGLTDDQIELAEAGPTVLFVEEDGARHILAVVPTQGVEGYEGLGWHVIARRPMAVALAGAYRIIWIILGIGLLAALASIACAFVLTGRMTRPIAQLAASADRIGRAPGAPIFGRQRGSADVLRLSSALRSLMRRIDFAERDAGEARDDVQRNRQMVQSLRLLADTDPMTNLLNRRGFLSHAADVFAFFKRYRSAFAILVVDIDRFKEVNDSYGHGAGDAVIKAVAQALLEGARETDRVARFGGEEFVLLLREIDRPMLEIRAERARSAVEAMTVATGGFSIKVTISIGATIVQGDDPDVEEIVRRADGALYRAKGEGRNRTIIAESQSTGSGRA